MRFLLDTHLLVAPEGAGPALAVGLATFLSLAEQNSHLLLYHPASEDELTRDTNTERRKQNLEKLKQFTRLDERPPCPWSTAYTRPNDAVDNELLYAVHRDAVHVLVTEDAGIFHKARERGLSRRVFSIKTAIDWLQRLHASSPLLPPQIQDVSLAALRPVLGSDFAASLRERYAELDALFLEQSIDERRAWVVWEQSGIPGALCVYARQDNAVITGEGRKLDRPALKLHIVEVSPTLRGTKIGELILKAAFRHATDNHLESIIIHGNLERHACLFNLLEDFGFARIGSHPGADGRDAVYLKSHPAEPPADVLEPLDYLKRFFPHFRCDATVKKLLVPLRPKHHRNLFPDYHPPSGRQLSMFTSSNSNSTGNGIKLACLCHAQTRGVVAGDVVLFYCSGDERAVTSVGVVESFETFKDAEAIACRMGRRTVYSMHEIEQMATKPTTVMLFRLVKHFRRPLSQSWLVQHGILRGAPHRILRIPDAAFEAVLASTD